MRSVGRAKEGYVSQVPPDEAQLTLYRSSSANANSTNSTKVHIQKTILLLQLTQKVRCTDHCTGAGNSDKASQPRKRGPRKKPEVPHSAPVGCKQRCRSSMPLVNFNSPMAPSIPTERRQSSLPLATYATSNTSFSAESTGGQAMTNHASPPEGDMHNPIKLQWAEKVAESITEYPKVRWIISVFERHY